MGQGVSGREQWAKRVQAQYVQAVGVTCHANGGTYSDGGSQVGRAALWLGHPVPLLQVGNERFVGGAKLHLRVGGVACKGRGRVGSE